MTDAIIIDLLAHDGSAWRGSDRISGASRTPEFSCARALAKLGLPLSTPVTFRCLSRAVRHSTLAFLLRPDAARSVTLGKGAAAGQSPAR